MLYSNIGEINGIHFWGVFEGIIYQTCKVHFADKHPFFLSSEISIETIPDELRTLFIFYTEDLFYEVKIIFVIFQEKKRRC